MPIFQVMRREVWTQAYEIEAKNPQEALKLVNEGKGDAQDDQLEYSRMLDKANLSDVTLLSEG